MSAVPQHELSQFMAMLNSIELRTFGEGVMVTAPSTSDALMVARRVGRNWEISIINVEEVPSWPVPE